MPVTPVSEGRSVTSRTYVAIFVVRLRSTAAAAQAAAAAVPAVTRVTMNAASSVARPRAWPNPDRGCYTVLAINELRNL